MDGNRFDELSRRLIAGVSRRGALKGAVAGVLGAAGLRRAGAGAQVTQATCGNVICANNPGRCNDGCVCCVYTNSVGRVTNSRCRPPGTCAPGTVLCPDGFLLDPGTGTCIPRSCFVAGTRVAMADGSSRPIEWVEVGDRVLGRDGRVNRVVGVQAPLLGGRLLYALNGSAPFVTSEHPFATEAGWKSIDPAVTAVENPSLAVGRLAVGDRLLTLVSARVSVLAGGGEETGPAEVRVEPILLRSLDGNVADPGTVVYNLLLDGDHAYFADDFLVHNRA